MFGFLLVFLAATLIQNCCSLSAFDNTTAEVTRVLKNAVNNYDTNLTVIDNAECVSQIRLFLKNLFNPTGDDMWALKMIDASAKIPSGVLEYNVAWIGNYDECLNIDSALTNVKGKYCLATIPVDLDLFVKNTFLGSQLVPSELLDFYKASTGGDEMKMPLIPSFGICIPDQCTDVDVQSIFQSLVSLVPWNVTCQTKESIHAPLDTGAILTLVYFGIFACMMALSTAYDLLRNKESQPHQLLIAFSVYTNGQKLLRISKNPNEFSCLHGIKFLSTAWVVYIHVFFSVVYGPVVNVLEVIRYFGTTGSMIFGNSGYSVDTFFVVTGMLVVYSFLKATHRGQKFNIFIFYLHRYIRLTPPLIAVILASIYLTKYIGHGPFHPELDWTIAEPCRNNWWTTILYIQNYANELKHNYCTVQTWYLDVDWQIYVICPVFLLFLPKRPKIGLAIMLCLLTGSMTYGYIVTWREKLQAVQNTIYGDLALFMSDYYFKSHTRVATWLIGGILGYILAKIQLQKDLTYTKIPRWLVGLIWIVVLTAIPVCVFVGHDTLTSREYHPYSNAFFNTFARPAWGLCIAWIIFACAIGYGGIINTFLSWSVFQVLNRFTYSIYLLHLTLLYIITFNQKTPGRFSLPTLAYRFWGIFALSFGISIFWVLSFESPVVALEQFFLRNPGRRREEKKVTNGTEPHPALGQSEP